MSPKSGGRAQRRQQRLLLTSVLVVVGISLASFAAVFAAGWSPRLGLDLAGGVSVVYTAEGNHISTADLNETVNILNLRVNGLGVSGAQVQTTGTNQISVSIPGVTNAQEVLKQIGQTARVVLPTGGVLRLPRVRAQARTEELHPAAGDRTGSRLPAHLRDQRVQPQRATEQRKPQRVHVEQRSPGSAVT